MPRVSIWVPDALWERFHEEYPNPNVSRVCQDALRTAIRTAIRTASRPRGRKRYLGVLTMRSARVERSA